MIDLSRHARTYLYLPVLLTCLMALTSIGAHAENHAHEHEADQTQQEPAPQIIEAIVISGNHYVPEEAILNKVPEQLAVGKKYDLTYTSTLINNVYDLGYFKQIHVLGEQLNNDRMNLHIIVQEKKRLEGVKFKGNKGISEETIRKKVPFDKPAVDEAELKKYCQQLQKLYREKDYHLVEITPELEEHDETATAIFNIKENKRSFIKRVHFKGNKSISSKRLRKAIFTRENWLLSFIDKAGTYQQEAIEMDKHGIEYFYQNHGYLMAKVIDADVVMDEKTKQYSVTFHIQEGDQYRVSTVHAQPHENFTEPMLLQRILLKQGTIYSREKLTKSIEILRLIWGEYGYIFADIIPSVQPDEKTKTVKISLNSELGEKVYLNRLTIKGNRKTRDKIIRRQFTFNEGELLTTRKMEESKDRTELLGYFDRKDGVNWKITRVGEGKADLDMMVKEVKTGKMGLQMGVGGSDRRGIRSASSSFKVGGGLSETNLFGHGLLMTLNGEFSKEEKNVLFAIADPWLFDKPIRGSLDLAYSKADYSEEVRNVRSAILERILGGSVGIGVYTSLPAGLGKASIFLQGGAENRQLSPRPEAATNLPAGEREEYQAILDRRFFEGNIGRFQFSINQDVRNHPQHPTRGYQWAFLTKVGVSDTASNFGFVRFELDASWYTPLIDDNKLYLGLHGNGGFVRQIGNRNIPFAELFHIGGPTTVRGFQFGEIGPRWKGSTTPGLGNSIGATNAFSWTAELIFPITAGFTAKGALFYDGGAGWKTPDANCIAPKHLLNNKFEYRHTVGIGLRLLKPTPMKIDWGFKLNPKKKLGEQVSELHFSMYREF